MLTLPGAVAASLAYGRRDEEAAAQRLNYLAKVIPRGGARVQIQATWSRGGVYVLSPCQSYPKFTRRPFSRTFPVLVRLLGEPPK